MNSVLMKIRDLENCIDLNPEQEVFLQDMTLNSSPNQDVIFLLSIVVDPKRNKNYGGKNSGNNAHNVRWNDGNDPHDPQIYKIIVPKDCQTTLVEIHCQNEVLNEGENLKSIYTRIELEPGSQLQHFILKQGASISYHRNVEVYQAENSFYTAYHLCTESDHTETQGTFHLQGHKAKCQVYSLMALQKQEQATLNLLFHHHQPDCQSQCIARNLFDDHSKGKWIGKIVVHPNAKKSTAILESKNLLLTKTAEVVNDPQFEIYHDDVSCKHGATVGQLDPNALFYLKSRGIPEKEAQNLLLNAFLEPILNRITLPVLQSLVERFRNFTYE